MHTLVNLYLSISAKTSPQTLNGSVYSTRNQTGATKRKRYEDDSSFNDETEDEETSFNSSKSSPALKDKLPSKSGRRRRKAAKKRKGMRTSPRKGSRRMNGRSYHEDEDEEEEEESTEDSESDSEEEDSGSDSEPRARRNFTGGRRGKPPPLISGKGKGGRPKKKRIMSVSEETETETEGSDTEVENSGSSSDSRSDNESDSSGPARKRTPRKRQSFNAKNSPRRTSQRPKHKTMTLHEEMIKAQQSVPRNTRNRGQRTINYDEDTDEENGLGSMATARVARSESKQLNNEEDSSGTDTYSDSDAATTSVSSRGRLRKLTARAKANLFSAS